MKRKLLYLLIGIFIFLVEGRPILAYTNDSVEWECGEDIELSPNKVYKNCKLYLDVPLNSGVSRTNLLYIEFFPQNMKLGSIYYAPDWYETSVNGLEYEIESTKTSFYPGKHLIATFTFYKENVYVECSVNIGILEKTFRTRICEIFHGVYYDKRGGITDSKTYDLECNKHTCEIIDGMHFGITGNKVDATTYDKECNPHYCEVIDGTYYDKKGNVTNELNYQKECLKNVCKILSDGTIYGKNGTVVTQDQYDLECNEKHYCKIVDNKYYDKNGKITDELTYQKECLENICKVLSDGTYFGKEGNIVTKEKYEEECFAKKTCIIMNDTYYGPDGKEISKGKYEELCLSKKPENPKTGVIMPIISLTILTIAGISLIYIGKKKSPFMD